MTATLIVFTGLPGTGKSSVAEAVGRMLGIPIFAKDWIEATLVRNDVRTGENNQPGTGSVAYQLLTTLAQQQLMLGQSVILDSVASTLTIRAEWRELANRYQAAWRVIECVCTDEKLHRQRLETRTRGIPGWHELSWDDVMRVQSYYVPWQEERLVLDTVNPLEKNIAAAICYIQI